MNIPIQFGLPQIVLIAIAIIGVLLLLSVLTGFFAGKLEEEIFEDDYGRRYRRWRRRKPRFRWGRGTSGLLMIVVAVFLLWLAFSVQTYLGLTSDIKVAQVQASNFANADHMMSVKLTQYNQSGQQMSDQTYLVKGDLWFLQGDMLKFPTWMNIFGIHSGYKLTRLEGLYEDPHIEDTAQHTDYPLNGGDDNFFKTVYKQAWSSPFVDAAYGNAVVLPADGHTYNIYVSQSGLYAKPA